MSIPRTCPRCGVELAAGSVEGLCPKCLLQEAFEPDVAEKPTATVKMEADSSILVERARGRIGHYKLLEKGLGLLLLPSRLKAESQQHPYRLLADKLHD